MVNKQTKIVVLQSVSLETGVTIKELLGKSRTDRIAGARHVAIYIFRNMFELKFREIAPIIHKSVALCAHAVNVVQAKVFFDSLTAYDRHIKIMVGLVKQRIKARLEQ